MRQLLLTVALLASSAFAGGAGPRPANAPAPVSPVTTTRANHHTLPASALIQPGQTWVVTGTTADNQLIEEELVLGKTAPKWNDGWDFESKLGMLHLTKDQDGLFAAALNPESGKMSMCLAVVEGKSMSGVLLYGDVEAVDKMMDAFPNYNSEIKTAAQLRQVFKDANFPVGSCTLKRH